MLRPLVRGVVVLVAVAAGGALVGLAATVPLGTAFVADLAVTPSVAVVLAGVALREVAGAVAALAFAPVFLAELVNRC